MIIVLNYMTIYKEGENRREGRNTTIYKNNYYKEV